MPQVNRHTLAKMDRALQEAPESVLSIDPDETPAALPHTGGRNGYTALEADLQDPGTPRGILHRQKAFLAAYRRLANVSQAAEVAQIERQTHYEWMDHDPAYPALFAQAQAQAGDQLHGKWYSALMRAEPEAVVNHPVAFIAELKRWFPEHYRDNVQVQITNQIAVQEVTNIAQQLVTQPDLLRQLADTERARLEPAEGD